MTLLHELVRQVAAALPADFDIVAGTYDRLVRRNPKLVNAIKGGTTTAGMVSRQEFADLFEVKDGLLLSSELPIAAHDAMRAQNLMREALGAFPDDMKHSA